MSSKTKSGATGGMMPKEHAQMVSKMVNAMKAGKSKAKGAHAR